MTKSLLYTFILAIWGTGSFGQKSDRETIINLLTKSNDFYSTALKYEMNLHFALYSSYTSSQRTESYDGVYVKSDKENYTKIGTTEIVNLSSESFKIDHETRNMQYGKSFQKADLLPELKSLVKNFSKFEITKTGDIWKCTLTAPAITFTPYGKVVIFIDSKSYQISKQIFYLLEAHPYRDKLGKVHYAYPRLEITCSNFKLGIKSPKKILQSSQYVIKTKKGLVPAAQYKNFTILQ